MRERITTLNWLKKLRLIKSLTTKSLTRKQHRLLSKSPREIAGLTTRKGFWRRSLRK